MLQPISKLCTIHLADHLSLYQYSYNPVTCNDLSYRWRLMWHQSFLQEDIWNESQGALLVKPRLQNSDWYQGL